EHDKPVIHSDRGGHYRWPGWLERINTSGLIRSMSRMDRYIRWYNEKRIKLSLGAMSPVKYRQHLGITT
ncbi:TPA: IS3 family transposase, partial [Klebsiella pneumoniae]|nr:IS3 family transposase [Klebsiella pneumoniae]HBS2697841.1 IS3 family transposase [Klebsiella pneumoniae]